MCSSYAFLRLECSLLRWRRTAGRRRSVCLHFMNVGQLQLSSGNHKGCTYRAPVRYVTKTWSVVLLNKIKHSLLSQVYCVWQVVKTPTIVLNNPVYLKNPPIANFTKICLVEGKTVPCRRTDRQIDGKTNGQIEIIELIIDFRNYISAAKISRFCPNTEFMCLACISEYKQQSFL